MTFACRILCCLVFAFASSAFAQDGGQDLLTDLKSRFLIALKDDPNKRTIDTMGTSIAPYLTKIINQLSNKYPDLRRDPDIRRALQEIQNNHPLTAARYYAKRALQADAEAKDRLPIFNSNRSRNYCSAQDAGVEPLPELPSGVIETLSPLQEELLMDLKGQTTRKIRKIEDIPIQAERLAEGWLTGYGARDLGLHYIPDDESRPTQPLIPGTIHAILPTHCDKTFYVFSTDAPYSPWQHSGWGQCQIALDVWKIREKTPGDFVVSPFRTLPDRIRSVGKRENGDLFLYFGGLNDVGCGWGGLEQSAYSNNPPIGFTRSGKIYAVCDGADTAKKY